MAFSSFHFFLFFPFVAILFYLLPHKFRWVLILLASALFYAFFSWRYLLFLLGIILFNYFLGIQMITKDNRMRKGLYVTGILVNIILLCFFKYFNYLEIDLEQLACFFGLHYPGKIIDILFPLGLSYFIFTSLSYLIDIKRQVIRPEKHAGIFASYFLFFPKVVQGPIERAGRVLPQFHLKHEIDPQGIKEGLILIVWGFFKKLVVADNLAIFVNAVYSNPGISNGPASFLAIILFGFQLYADFSGYTDIALGTAKVLGFDLTQNFRRPFLAKSIRDFWTRWHISLSSWCSDYIFLPILTYSYELKKKIKKSRFFRRLSAEKVMYVIAAFVTFLIIGVWHGVGWTYITVGLIFGFYVSFDMLTKDFRKRVNVAAGITKFPRLFQNIQILTTFFLLLIIWLFFRASSMEDAFVMFHDLFKGWSVAEIRQMHSSFDHLGLNWVQVVAGLVSLGFLLYTDILSEKRDFFERTREKPAIIRWSFYFILIFTIILFSAVESKQFIYTQF